MGTPAHLARDNFNDNIRGNPWRFVPLISPNARETNGRLEITLASGVAGGSGQLQTLGTFELIDSHLRVELVRAPRHHPHVETYLAYGNYLRLYLVNGELWYTQQGEPDVQPLKLADYDPRAHRWLGVRESNGTTFVETSPDGRVWNVLYSAATHENLSFIGQIVLLGAVTREPVASPGVVIFDNFNTPPTGPARRTEERRRSAGVVRAKAAQVAAARLHEEHFNNNDEVNYPALSYVGSYSKSLRHDDLGDPEPVSYGSLLRALESRDTRDFEEIILASSTAVKLTNPQAGLAFDVAGPDAQERTMPPAPRFDSDVTAHEAGELYWMAVARDVPFAEYGSDVTIAGAVVSLNNEFPRFGGTLPVTTQNVFRGIYPGEQVGPYVSQFLLKGNNDPRKPNGHGRDADEGFITYGAQVIDQRILCATPGVDYLTDFPWWLTVQNGTDTRGQDSIEPVRRFIRTLRDGATYVHFDQVINAFYNAALILHSEPTGDQETGVGSGRPMIDLEFLKNRGNPYDPPGTADDSRTQTGFGTFGPIHMLQVLSEVLGRAIRAVWWQKWGVHRRLRPEEFGGRVDNWIVGRRDYPIHPSIKSSLTTGGLAPYFGQSGERFQDAYLLPQAYPEGAPTHPAYGAGHATGSGACATILKAFFDEGTPIENPVLASADGLWLESYTRTDAGQMTVGGELNKLAGNIALFRNAAGVHWRSDYTESLPFGEAIAIGLLQEMSLGFNEDDAFFELTKFDGQKIRIFDGKVVPVVV